MMNYLIRTGVREIGWSQVWFRPAASNTESEKVRKNWDETERMLQIFLYVSN